ncbi:hypothetical protein TNCV_937071 [Trichonephila clavipes]|nr:hypothetical protein TNCV_937071 [Trichonephila clavipes]
MILRTKCEQPSSNEKSNEYRFLQKYGIDQIHQVGKTEVSNSIRNAGNGQIDRDMLTTIVKHIGICEKG